ncbi:alpha/beta fold hydrolase [Amycolatopsis acididurans]|nr:alpha/beta hydrolase [Amycolatopsis acididurans]
MIEVNGIRTHYQRTAAKNVADGTTPPLIVFVHGLAIDSLASFYLWLAAPAANAGMEGLFYDLRGHGRTARPADPYRLADFVADLDALLTALDIDVPVHLVGSSFGGTVAFSYAAEHPERVASIVSLDTGPATETWARHTRAALRALVDDAAENISRLGVDGTFAWIAEHEDLRAARMFKAAHGLMAGTTVLDDIFAGPLLEAGELRDIRCPVLSIVGSDGFHRDDLTMLDRVLPRCRTEVVQGGSHFLLTGMPGTVRGLVLDWVRERHQVPA